MTYVPIKYIVINGTSISEYTDLTVITNTLLGKNGYLVVANSTTGALYSLSISNMSMFTPQINLATAIGTTFNSLFTDLFVQQYMNNHIPIAQQSGYYKNRVKVLNPISYKNWGVNFTSVNTPTTINDPLNIGTLDDLAINFSDDPTIPDFNNSLVAVNGVFHKTTVFEDQLYVLDGFRTMRISGRKDTTLVDTSAIGGHTVLPLTTSNVSQRAYNEYAYITLPSSIAGKTIAIVIDGYFYHLNNHVLDVLSDTLIGIRTNLLPLVQQFRHNPRTMYEVNRLGPAAPQNSTRYTDPYELMFIGNKQVPSSTFDTLAFQYSRLTAFHSFLVIFNNGNIFNQEREVIPTGTPRFYYDYTTLPLDGMLQYGCGLCPSYLIHKEPKYRSQIFISGYDNDMDLQNLSMNPSFIPDLIPDPERAAHLPAKFVDYVSA